MTSTTPTTSPSPPPLTPSIPATGTAYASRQNVTMDGRSSKSFQMYALKDANGNATNYIRVRDLAEKLDFDVVWQSGKGIMIESEPISG